ncbi:unnamed protein product [Ectocarpus sp. CCAP 1310/34]|nr:unnamed protein product [Ectocarpus sp. CCAP 1310/34]
MPATSAPNDEDPAFIGGRHVSVTYLTTNPGGSKLSETIHRTLHGTRVVLKRMAVVVVYVVALVVGALVLLLYAVVVLPPKRARKRFLGTGKEDEMLTNDWWGLHDGDDVAAREKRSPRKLNMRKDIELRTCYITTRDGVKLATDVWIPLKALEKRKTLPVVFHQASFRSTGAPTSPSRYYRSATLRWPFNLFVNGGKPISFINDPFFKSFLSHDMVLVSVDVRGTGASFGTHPGPWSPEEQQDSLEVLDWIDRQSWSNGRVALWGLSYEGTSAFFTSLLRHPSVGFNDSLDSGWVQSTGWMAKIFLEGVTPVKSEDSWGYQAHQAINQHKDNWSLLEDDHIRYMDDRSRQTGRMVGSACASQAVQKLLAERHGCLGPAPGPSSNPRGGGGPGSEEPSCATLASPPNLDGSTSALNADCSSEESSERKSDSTPNGKRSTEENDCEDSGGESAGAGGGTSGSFEEKEEGDDQEKNDGATRQAQSGDEKTVEEAPQLLLQQQQEEESLEKVLPFYLHVSGWLDASAHAAVMAFTTLPCRFDFKTEVSGFLVQRLSQDTPSDSAKAPASPAHTTPARLDVPSSSSPTQSVPLLQDGGDTGADAAAGVDAVATEAGTAAVEDGGGGGGGGGGASVLLDESQESKALWKRARPREERWHDSADFPSDRADKTDVSLFLGGTEQCPLSTMQTVPGGAATNAQKEGGGAPTIHHGVSAEGVEGSEGGGGSEQTGRVLKSSGGEAAADGSGAEAKRGVRGRLSSRLASWPAFRNPRLTLSQGSGAREEEAKTHELEVDMLEDHDGEGISRWAAMTEFLSLISYQMDGMRSNHLRFTSAPLRQDIEVTGYPVVSLWVSAADDIANLDVFAYLQAVRPRTGLSIYVTEGCFRAEHRKEALRTEPVDVRALPGVPIHSYLRSDAQPLRKGQPVEIKFKLMPTSFKFLKGQRVRLSIGGADARHFHPIIPTPPGSRTASTGDAVAAIPGRSTAAPGGSASAAVGGQSSSVVTKRVLRVHTGGAFASSISLPVPCRGGNDIVGAERGSLRPGGEEGRLATAQASNG